MNRRGFLSSILALGVAPAIVRADSLMRIIPRETSVFVAGIESAPIAASGNVVTMVDRLGRTWRTSRELFLYSPLTVSKLIVPEGCTVHTNGHSLLVGQTLTNHGTIIADTSRMHTLDAQFAYNVRPQPLTK